MRDQINRLYEYAEALSGPMPVYLRELERETHLKTLAPQMLSGPLQGRLLALFSKLLGPKHVLEVGTFTGYATLCLAEGLAPDGVIDTIEGNPEITYLAEKYFKRAGFDDRIRQHQGNALEILPTLTSMYDLVFLDANKREYQAYFDLIIDRIRPGGVLVADNVLWSGRVIDDLSDPDAAALDAFNHRMLADTRLECLLLPLRDGLLVLRKQSKPEPDARLNG